SRKIRASMARILSPRRPELYRPQIPIEVFPPKTPTLKANIESFLALISEALDGSKKVIAQKDKQREAVVKMLRLLGRYVEVTSNGDMAIFTSSGFQPASTIKVPPSPLPLPVIRSVVHGALSGEI